MRLLALSLFLAATGCTPLEEQVQNTNGQPIPLAYVFMQPLCLLFCNTALTTSGVDNDTIGENATGGASSNTQSTGQTQGAAN